MDRGDEKDFSAASSYSLYEDTRMRLYQLYHHKYPYTVVYEYKVRYDGLINLPSWYPQGENQYVEKATLNVSAPAGLEVRFHSENLDAEPERLFEGNRAILKWSLHDMKSPSVEPYGPPWVRQVPRVLLALDEFRIEDQPGEMDSWENFGKWYFNLSKNRDQLPESTKREVQQLVAGIEDRETKVRQLYRYMQGRTRYVSVQLGLGGWQPYKAEYVDRNGYGDCKALTNYMQALLASVDIEAYPVLIRNGLSVPPLITDFPSSQFNHVVLSIPGPDTLWLESTSQSLPFNYLGVSNSDRLGLMVTENGGKLVKTPAYGPQINRKETRAIVRLGLNGDAELEIRRTYSGAYLDMILSTLAHQSERERRRWLYDNIGINGVEILETDFSSVDRKERVVQVIYTLRTPAFASKTGSRLFVPVNRVNAWSEKLPRDVSRTRDIHLDYPFSQVDRFEIAIPRGYGIEALPDGVRLETEFGSFENVIEQDTGNRILFSRKLILHRKRVPAEQYDELRSFFNNVTTADAGNLVLREL